MTEDTLASFDPRFPGAFIDIADDDVDDRVTLNVMNDQGDLDWEMQRRALEDGPFWVGASEVEGEPMEGPDQWMQDEVEMRWLIDREEEVEQYIDPVLQGIEG